MSYSHKNQGLYDSRFEHDACGIGAVVNISGKKEHSILKKGNQILLNLHHRGAAGSDGITGDGAGILFQLPDEFLRSECKSLGIELPELNKYAAGNVFLPRDKALKEDCIKILEESIAHYGLKLLGWRKVPTNNKCLGPIALSAEPEICQVFVDGCGLEDEDLERKLFLARRRSGRRVNSKHPQQGKDYYISSISCKTICYKGMFMAWQLFEYYPDLTNKKMKSALAIVHQRYSTNTFPSWKLAQPFRSIAHNGEINTLSGNRNSILAAEEKMESELFGDDLQDLFPVSTKDASDSACFDNVLELLVRSGRSMPHAIMMMIPEAFGPKYHISTDKRVFYEYHASIMEPWDGPAAMVFTDGRYLGGVLDRNGLRPCRYVITTEGQVVLASESGVIDIPATSIRSKGRLRPGKLFLVDTKQGRIISDNEIKSIIARQKPYRRWLNNNRIELRGLFDAPKKLSSNKEDIYRKLGTFGYTIEELNMLLKPMAVNAQEPVGSMGNDTPLAVLSDQPKLLFNYFKQMFAQVTNPPIDPLREGLVMSLMMFIGKRRNILTETPAHCRQLKLPHPILTNTDIERLRSSGRDDFKVSTIQSLFDAGGDNPAESLRKALEKLVNDAKDAISQGSSILIISDRDSSKDRVPIPSLLATSAVHHGLLNCRLRSEVGLIIESGEPREVMHFCLLMGFGANAINPYLAFETLQHLQTEGYIPGEMETSQISDNYIAAVKKGILKTMSKMGISTLRSYRQAQLFEAIGINREVIDKYFVGTASRIQGIGLDQIAADALARNDYAYRAKAPGSLKLQYGGDYHYRVDGEQHLWNPTTIARVQHAVMFKDSIAYQDYSAAVNDQSKKIHTLRGLFEFKQGKPVDINEVEPAENIVKRFCTGAMSHGSISKEAHECMAVAMNRLGGMSNTGEGGEQESRYTPEPNGDSKNCAIKQVASGRFGVTINYLANAKEIQIKMAQGAKPGEGGQLPGYKVTEEIAEMRHSTPGVTLISPPPHHDIYSIEDLAQLIYDLKCSNPGAKVSVKLVSEVGVGTIASGVAKGNADEVLISGHDGGTGASPQSSIKHAGGPWELGLAETQQVLVINGLRDRIRVQTDGQLKTGRDVVIAALLGADQFGFGTVALVTMGCTLLRKCHEGACTYGIATQDPELRKRFAGKPEYIQRFMMFVAEEVRQYMARLGFRSFDEMIGRSDMLDMKKAIDHYKTKGLDLSCIFHQPETDDYSKIRLTSSQPETLEDHLDWDILKKFKKSIDSGKKISAKFAIKNTNRTVGAILSNHIVKKYGSKGLPDGTIDLTVEGSAGQSFGAFLIKGVQMRLIGDSNDYLGKGLSGGRIIVQAPEKRSFIPHENIIAGNTLLYGATSGEVFINGIVGERFCVRNSGATAVVEGIGDHGCEYMTGGTVVVLGSTGCNFAAGMSGGVAYVLDRMQLFDTLCNLDMVDLESVWQQNDKEILQDLINRHYRWTGSLLARDIIENWDNVVGRFVKVIPIDYKKALERMREKEHRDTESTPATEEVFNG